MRPRCGPKRGADQRDTRPSLRPLTSIGGSNALTSSLILGYALSRIGVGIGSCVLTPINPKSIRSSPARRKFRTK